MRIWCEENPGRLGGGDLSGSILASVWTGEVPWLGIAEIIYNMRDLERHNF